MNGASEAGIILKNRSAEKAWKVENADRCAGVF